jgi:hypothetical protein
MRTIARFQFPENAWLFRSFLRDREIDAHVFDEHVVQWQWTLSDAIGGVRVVVPLHDVEEACALWREYHDNLNRAPSILTIARGGWPLLVIGYFTLGVYLVFGRRKLHQAATPTDAASADTSGPAAP